MRGPALLIGIIGALLALVLIFGAIELPQRTERLLDPIPVKFLLLEIGLAVIAVAGFLVYWSFQLPRTARVALGLLRACIGFTAAAIATPFSFLGIQNLSLAINQKVTISIAWDTSINPAFAVGIVALLVAAFSLREYREARTYEHLHGAEI